MTNLIGPKDPNQLNTFPTPQSPPSSTSSSSSSSSTTGRISDSFKHAIFGSSSSLNNDKKEVAERKIAHSTQTRSTQNRKETSISTSLSSRSMPMSDKTSLSAAEWRTQQSKKNDCVIICVDSSRLELPSFLIGDLEVFDKALSGGFNTSDPEGERKEALDGGQGVSKKYIELPYSKEAVTLFLDRLVTSPVYEIRRPDCTPPAVDLALAVEYYQLLSEVGHVSEAASKEFLNSWRNYFLNTTSAADMFSKATEYYSLIGKGNPELNSLFNNLNLEDVLLNKYLEFVEVESMMLDQYSSQNYYSEDYRAIYTNARMKLLRKLNEVEKNNLFYKCLCCCPHLRRWEGKNDAEQRKRNIEVLVKDASESKNPNILWFVGKHIQGRDNKILKEEIEKTTGSPIFVILIQKGLNDPVGTEKYERILDGWLSVLSVKQNRMQQITALMAKDPDFGPLKAAADEGSIGAQMFLARVYSRMEKNICVKEASEMHLSLAKQGSKSAFIRFLENLEKTYCGRTFTVKNLLIRNPIDSIDAHIKDAFPFIISFIRDGGVDGVTGMRSEGRLFAADLSAYLSSKEGK